MASSGRLSDTVTWERVGHGSRHYQTSQEVRPHECVSRRGLSLEDDSASGIKDMAEAVEDPEPPTLVPVGRPVSLMYIVSLLPIV